MFWTIETIEPTERGKNICWTTETIKTIKILENICCEQLTQLKQSKQLNQLRD